MLQILRITLFLQPNLVKRRVAWNHHLESLLQHPLVLTACVDNFHACDSHEWLDSNNPVPDQGTPSPSHTHSASKQGSESTFLVEEAPIDGLNIAFDWPE